MSRTIIDNFKMYFPSLSEDVVKYRIYNDYELVVEFADGDVWVFDDYVHNLRKLPSNPNDISKEECMTEFGTRLTRLMLLRCMTQEELSEKTGIAQPTLSSYINGRNIPSFYKVDKIARALKCSIDQLRYF